MADEIIINASEPSTLLITVGDEVGVNGIGVPAGGQDGYILSKASNTDFDTEWIPNASGGTVTSVSFQDGNGFDGSVTNPTSAPVISVAIGVSGVLKGVGGALAAADKSDIGLGNVDNTSDVNKPVSTATQTALDLKIDLSQKGSNNGVATLDSGGKVPASQLPSTVMEYRGNWNASTNTPTLVDGVGDAGDVYRCNVAGSVNLGSGSISFAIGDWAVYNGSIWEKSINSNYVLSVNGQQGTVVLSKTDIGLSNVDNTSDVNKPISSATQSALDTKIDKNTPISAATKTKIQYDINGLIVSGSDATTADISDSVNKRYVTDSQLTILSNTSGTNTGDQTDATLVFSDITTNNASTVKHGFLPKLSGNANTYLNGSGSFSTIQSGISFGKIIATNAGFILP